ncbi:MAG: hypothetical protein KJ941_13395 [Bacteroidetes bacterium]|nr:hypothetical protein [Bacteroidota bacterium]
MTTKKRAIVSYDKMSVEQKKGILREFPDGYINHLTQIKTPTGELLDALIWETDETIYLVKFPKVMKAVTADDDDDDDELDDVDDIKDEEEDEADDEEEDQYDKPDKDTEEDDKD